MCFSWKTTAANLNDANPLLNVQCYREITPLHQSSGHTELLLYRSEWSLRSDKPKILHLSGYVNFARQNNTRVTPPFPSQCGDSPAERAAGQKKKKTAKYQVVRFEFHGGGRASTGLAWLDSVLHQKRRRQPSLLSPATRLQQRLTCTFTGVKQPKYTELWLMLSVSCDLRSNGRGLLVRP